MVRYEQYNHTNKGVHYFPTCNEKHKCVAIQVLDSIKEGGGKRSKIEGLSKPVTYKRLSSIRRENIAPQQVPLTSIICIPVSLHKQITYTTDHENLGLSPLERWSYFP